jgi:hypothetical protein
MSPQLPQLLQAATIACCSPPYQALLALGASSTIAQTKLLLQLMTEVGLVLSMVLLLLLLTEVAFWDRALFEQQAYPTVQAH